MWQARHVADRLAALHPDLKTHMLEHHWLQGRPSECNPAFGDDGAFYLNGKRLLGWASSRGSTVDASALGELTLSVLEGEEGAGVAHAGWRGAAAGVVARGPTAPTMPAL